MSDSNFTNTAKYEAPKLSLKRRFRRFHLEPAVFHTVNYFLMALLCVVMLYPMLYTIAVSFSDAHEVTRGNVRLWPRGFTTYNYQVVFNMHSIFTAFRNSVLRTVVGVVTNLLFTTMLAYAVSRQEYIFRRGITLIYILTMYFDPGLIPGYLLIQQLGLTNTFTVYWLPGMVSAFNLIIIRTFIKGIPESLIESARLDGAGEFRVYAQIVMPLCKPVLATVALFVAVGNWNAWFDNFIYNASNPDLTTLQFELNKILRSTMSSGQGAAAQVAAEAQNALGIQQVTPTVIRATITVVAAIPILVVYPFLQRYFVAGVKLGGVKE